ncbi:MAG: hypothetical protein AAGF73_11670 [Actinomycetota bacterium]
MQSSSSTCALVEQTGPQGVTKVDMPGINRLAAQIDINGLPSVERDVVELARAVAATDVSPTLVEVVSDNAAPMVARVRAFGLLACQINRLAA